jgi:hypothetical protein
MSVGFMRFVVADRREHYYTCPQDGESARPRGRPTTPAVTRVIPVSIVSPAHRRPSAVPRLPVAHRGLARAPGDARSAVGPVRADVERQCYELVAAVAAKPSASPAMPPPAGCRAA